MTCAVTAWLKIPVGIDTSMPPYNGDTIWVRCPSGREVLAYFWADESWASSGEWEWDHGWEPEGDEQGEILDNDWPTHWRSQ